MIYKSPTLERDDLAVLSMIEAQKNQLKLYTNSPPKRWFGSLRRNMMARAIQGSNSIEGYNTSLDNALAVVEDEPMVDEKTETGKAIRGYREALTYICQAAQDPYFEFSKQFLKSLHFMMIGFDLSKYPGQWRPGSIFVINSKNGETVYTAPPVEIINPLIDELIADLKEKNDDSSIIKGALAHLNLTMIHPFKDGNGRMARALQTLVISLGGSMHPAFSSIEEWLGDNTLEYYQILSQMSNGEWSPQHSTLPWVRFCLKAHYQQAATLIRRNEEYDKLFEKIIEIAKKYHLSDRVQMSLFDAALGWRVTNLRYKTDADVSEIVASRDLKKLCELELFQPFGEKRGRYYQAGQELKTARLATRQSRSMNDPYKLV